MLKAPVRALERPARDTTRIGAELFSMPMLITGSDPNRPDAERCVAWLLDYYNRQAAKDGLSSEQINVSMTMLVTLCTDLRSLPGELSPWQQIQRQ